MPRNLVRSLVIIAMGSIVFCYAMKEDSDFVQALEIGSVRLSTEERYEKVLPNGYLYEFAHITHYDKDGKSHEYFIEGTHHSTGTIITKQEFEDAKKTNPGATRFAKVEYFANLLSCGWVTTYNMNDGLSNTFASRRAIGLCDTPDKNWSDIPFRVVQAVYFKQLGHGAKPEETKGS